MFGSRFSSSIGLVGVDMGTGGVKLLQVREHQQRLQVVGAASVDIPLGSPREVDSQILTDGLRAAFNSGGFTGRRCAVALPRREVQVHSVRLPRMPESELKQAAIWEASQRFGFDREAMEVDYIRTGATMQGGENREEILLLAAPHASLNPLLGPVMAAGLRPVAVDTDFVALARFFSRKARRESDVNLCRVVVEVGRAGSTVMILRGDQIAFCKSIETGGEDFNRAVARQLDLDEAAAAELRSNRIANADAADHGPEDPATDRAVFEAVRPLMGDLVKEVVLCLRYYGVTFRGHPPERIILTGGDGLEPAMDTMLAQECKLPVVHDDRSDTLEGIGVEIRNKMNRVPGPAATWAVAAGLSARGLSVKKPSAIDDSEQEMRRGAA